MPLVLNTKLNFDVTEAQAQVRKLKQEVQQVSGASGGVNKALGSTSKAAKNLGKETANLSQRFQGLGSAVSIGTASLQTFAGGASGATAGALQMTSALGALAGGMGPITIAVAAALAVFTAFSAIQSDLAEKTETLNSLNNRAASRVSALADQMQRLHDIERARAAGITVDELVQSESLENLEQYAAGLESVAELTERIFKNTRESTLGQNRNISTSRPEFKELEELVQSVGDARLSKGFDASQNILAGLEVKTFRNFLTRQRAIIAAEIKNRQALLESATDERLEKEEQEEKKTIDEVESYRLKAIERTYSMFTDLQNQVARSEIDLIDDQFERQRALAEQSFQEQLRQQQELYATGQIDLTAFNTFALQLAVIRNNEIEKIEMDRIKKVTEEEKKRNDELIKARQESLKKFRGFFGGRVSGIAGDLGQGNLDQLHEEWLRASESDVQTFRRLVREERMELDSTRAELQVERLGLVQMLLFGGPADEINKQIAEVDKKIQTVTTNSLKINAIDPDRVRMQQLLKDVASSITPIDNTIAGLTDLSVSLQQIEEDIESLEKLKQSAVIGGPLAAGIDNNIANLRQQGIAMTAGMLPFQSNGLSAFTSLSANSLIVLSDLIDNMAREVDSGLGDAVFSALQGEADEVKEIFRNMFLDIAEDGTKALLDALANLFIPNAGPGSGGVGGLVTSLLTSAASAAFGGGGATETATAAGVNITNVNVQEDGAKQVIQAVNKKPNEIVNVIDSKRGNYRSTTRTL